MVAMAGTFGQCVGRVRKGAGGPCAREPSHTIHVTLFVFLEKGGCHGIFLGEGEGLRVQV